MVGRTILNEAGTPSHIGRLVARINAVISAPDWLAKTNAAHVFPISNGWSGNAATSTLEIGTGTANATRSITVVDNSGAPFAELTNGSAITTVIDQSNVHVWATNANVTKGNLTAAGLAIVGNITATGNLSPTGNISAGNLAISHDAAITGNETVGGNLTVTGRATAGNATLNGTSGGLTIGSGQVITVGAVQVLKTRQTGWGAASGALSRSALAAYAGQTYTGSYVQATVQATDDALKALAQHFAALVTDLTAHGVIGP